MNNKWSPEPLGFVKWFVMGFMAILVIDTFSVQVVNADVYKNATAAFTNKRIYAERGRIMDRNGIVFADNVVNDSCDNPNKSKFGRVFLQGSLGSQIVGKLNYAGHGNMGLEMVYDTILDGINGIRRSVRGVKRIQGKRGFGELYGRSEELTEPIPGKSLVLTVNRDMQEIVEKELKNAVLYFNLGTYMGNNYRACIITAQNALKDYPYTKYREELSMTVLRAKYQMAVESVADKEIDRYRDAVDEYYAFKNEFPESKYLKEAEKIFRNSSKKLEN